MDESTAALPGLLAGRFEIQREIGRGAMATVYLARDLKHDRRVAVKVMRPDLAESVGTDRFLREIRTAARLQHPHILPLHDSGEVPASGSAGSGSGGAILYYVMPFVEGESLRDRIARQGPLPLDDALRIAREVADALAYAHAHDVVHRDIKPENILLAAPSGDGGVTHALVADFGIARAISSADGQTLTAVGLAVGTPAYMAPEQAAAERAVDGRSDMYALGCVLYEMLSGHPPFLGTTGREVVARHLMDPVPPLRTSRPDIPEPIERAIARSLAKSPADRFATTSAFSSALAAPVPTQQRKPLGRATMFLVGGLVVLASAYTIVSQRSSSAVRSTATDATSIAVLAFRNIGGDPSNEPLSDGISEEIATTLGKLEGLHVKAPRSAFSFKAKSMSLAEIGERLGVRYLIDGGVSKAGNQLRITVQLISAANDSTLWAEDYRRPDADVFAVQDEIARAVSEKLRVQLTTGARATIAARSTDNPEAHALYLQGRYFFEKRDSAALARAQQYFEQAIAKDSSYALAYAELSDTHSRRSAFGFAAPNESFPLAKRYAATAFALDSMLAEAHSSLGFIALFYDWDFPTAGREFKRALTLSPNYPSAHLWQAWYYMAADSTDAAIAAVRRAVELDPFWLVGNTRLVTLLFYSGRYSEALTQAQHTFEIDSSFFQVRAERGRVYLHLGQCAEALEDLTRSSSQGAAQLIGVRGYAYARCGRTADAQAELRQLVNDARLAANTPHYGLAVIHAGLGDADQAIAELERAYLERAWPMFMLRREPAFEGLRNDPRFAAIMKRVGLTS